MINLYLGLIIAGGLLTFDLGATASVEVFVPSTLQHCLLPDIPGDIIDGHSLHEKTICGGISTGTSCITLSDGGTWENTTTLLQRRSFFKV